MPPVNPVAPQSPSPGPIVQVRGVSHVLLDIEGTTCPVSYVADQLFPYAEHRMAGYLEDHGESAVVQALLRESLQALEQDPDPAALALRGKSNACPLEYLKLLMQQDRKLTPLKELQGLIWEAGYSSGELRAPLYPDVSQAIRRWLDQALVLAVYSSGSVKAQQLLYGHSTSGDLKACFQHWFDTRIGAKQQAASYRAIAETMNVPPCRVLFISDALAECEAAKAAGLQALFSSRPGNPARACGSFPVVDTYDNLEIVCT